MFRIFFLSRIYGQSDRIPAYKMVDCIWLYWFTGLYRGSIQWSWYLVPSSQLRGIPYSHLYPVQPTNRRGKSSLMISPFTSKQDYSSHKYSEIPLLRPPKIKTFCQLKTLFAKFKLFLSSLSTPSVSLIRDHLWWSYYRDFTVLWWYTCHISRDKISWNFGLLDSHISQNFQSVMFLKKCIKNHTLCVRTWLNTLK